MISVSYFSQDRRYKCIDSLFTLTSAKLAESIQTFKQIQILVSECDPNVEDDAQIPSFSLFFLHTDASVYQSTRLTSQSHTRSFDLSA